MISTHDQFVFAEGSPLLSREARIGWIGSKLAQATGIETERLDGLHHRLWMRILQMGLVPAPVRSETDQLAVHILAVAELVENVATKDGPKAAIAAVMQASGRELEPFLADRFLRIASSPIFWLALDRADSPHGDAH